MHIDKNKKLTPSEMNRKFNLLVKKRREILKMEAKQKKLRIELKVLEEEIARNLSSYNKQEVQ